MAHPQSTPRGFIAHKRIDVGSHSLTYNSTALILSGGVKVSGAAGGALTANSTGLIAPGSVFPSAGTVGITANSTGIVLPAIYVGAWSTGIAVDSTGITIGAGAYISTNSTGNGTT